MDSSDGAIAALIDISCLYGTEDFAKSQDDIYNVWEKYYYDGLNTWQLIYQFLYELRLPVFGTHYFVDYADTILPKFDFTSVGPYAGNPDAFVVGTRVAGIPAPNSARDIDWIELNAVEGKFADKVYRVETRGGQPPTSVSSVRLYFDILVQSCGLLRSAPQDQIRSLSSMLHNTVSALGLAILSWPLLTPCI